MILFNKPAPSKTSVALYERLLNYIRTDDCVQIIKRNKFYLSKKTSSYGKLLNETFCLKTTLIKIYVILDSRLKHNQLLSFFLKYMEVLYAITY